MYSNIMEPEIQCDDYGVTYSKFIGGWFLAWKQNKSQKELASYLGMSYNAVKTRRALYKRLYGIILPALDGKRPPKKKTDPRNKKTTN